MNKKFNFSDILIGINYTILFISLAVILVINFRPLYYMDVDLLNIPATSGYSKEVIIENYDALIEYNSPFFIGPLKFPSLPSSPYGTQHFIEVKRIFMGFYFLFLVTLVIAIFSAIYKKRQKSYNYLKTISITSIVLPLMVGSFVAINFDKAFVIFHKIFFRNDYWLFDPDLDPIINILPDTFFLHCALAIIILVLLMSCICYLTYRKYKKMSCN